MTCCGRSVFRANPRRIQTRGSSNANEHARERLQYKFRGVFYRVLDGLVTLFSPAWIGEHALGPRDHPRLRILDNFGQFFGEFGSAHFIDADLLLLRLETGELAAIEPDTITLQAPPKLQVGRQSRIFSGQESRRAS